MEKIHAENRERYRTVLGAHYVKKVKSVLVERGVRNSEGNPYDTAMISHVFNGNRTQPEIIDAIETAYDRECVKKGIKKPEGATSGSDQ